MRVLVACECSGEFRDAFLALGHDAISCDLKPTRKPGPHYHGDVRDILYEQWDLLIAHPVCKFLTNAGVRWLHEREGRWELMEKGVEFFKLFDNAKHIPRRAIENPIMHGYALKLIGRRATQFVQPWMFGDPFSKATGWWLHRLPKLTPTHRKSDYGVEIEQECWLTPRGPDREELRSKSYPGMARVAAETWGAARLAEGDQYLLAI
jgi:hypothetical protein